MTLEQFLEALEKTPRDWRITHQRYIRRGDNNQCPLTCLIGTHAGRWFLAAQVIGIEDIAAKIVRAADGREPKRLKWLRAKLLKACGL